MPHTYAYKHMHITHTHTNTHPPTYPPTQMYIPHHTHAYISTHTNVRTHVFHTQELDLLEDDAVVYKLVGPVLVRQELSEARQTVEKRLDYISKEL